MTPARTLESALSEGRFFGTLLRSATRTFLLALQNHVAQYDLTLHQYFVLRELWDEPGINQRVLCARLNAHEPAMVATLGAMVKLGYVVRQRNEKDRRHSHLALTPAGRALTRKVFRGIARVNQRAVAGMSAAEVTQLRDLLTRAQENLDPAVAVTTRSASRAPRVVRVRL